MKTLLQHLTAGFIAGGVLLSAAAPPAAAGVEGPPNHNVWQYKYNHCTDKAARKLVGMTKEKALIRVGKMNLYSYRLVDPQEPVNFEVIPQRLTLVVGSNDVIQRAFCR